MKLIQIAPILGIHDQRAARVAQLGLQLSLPMWIGFLSFLAYVPGLEGLGLQRIAGFFGFSGFFGLFGVASMMDMYSSRRSAQPK